MPDELLFLAKCPDCGPVHWKYRPCPRCEAAKLPLAEEVAEPIDVDRPRKGKLRGGLGR